mmetsp:Transcript_34446/g.61951  ORF Transcript_34446/g.61951 Transcript_34446/m.61951 type:complete len:261 (+) Transcript_34446:1222-2004(+)
MRHRPGCHAESGLQHFAQLRRPGHQRQGRAVPPQGSRHHCLVLDRVEAASAINQASADLQQLEATIEDVELPHVQGQATLPSPGLPNERRLPHGAITRARHVAENSVEAQLLSDAVLVRWAEKVREELGVLIHHHHAGRAEPIHLVREHVCAPPLQLVGHDQAARRRPARGPRLHLRPVHDLKHLRGLRARCGAEIQDKVMRLDAHEERRQHADRLLPGDEPSALSLCQVLFEADVPKVLLDNATLQSGPLPAECVLIPF